MELNGWMVATAFTLIGLIIKMAFDHKTTAENKDSLVLMAERLDTLEKEQLRITEALDRTYASKEYVYEAFVTRKEFIENVAHLEEKLVGEMKHLNHTMDKMYKAFMERDKA